MTGGQRTWTEAEIEAWRESCPVEGPALKGAAKEKHGRRQRKAADSVSNSASA